MIESPYFVLGDATIERVRQLTARGVKVRVLTNSAASHELMDEVISPSSAFRVTLDKDDNLVWSAENNETKVEYDRDPETGFLYRVLIGVIGMLPIEDQL